MGWKNWPYWSRILVLIVSIFVLITGTMVIGFFSLFKSNPVDIPVKKVIFINLDLKDDELIKKIQNEFEKKFDIKTEIQNQDIDFVQTYDKEKRQYDALKIIEQIEIIPLKEERVFAFTSKNIYRGSLNFVFSTTDKGKNVGVLSTYYIGMGVNDDLLFERTMKIILRMFGATMGFSSTFDRNCVMAFSNNLQELDEKSMNFCEKNKEHLSSLGMIKEYS